MGFRGQAYAFDSPAAAVAGMVSRLGPGPGGVEEVVLEAARGRVLAEPVRADRDSPAFDHSAMDGYAVRLADVGGAGEGRLAVAGEVVIGTPPMQMPAGPSAVRIVTGAAIPPGADTVIRREDVHEHPGHIAVHASLEKIRFGDHIRRRGENTGAGGVVLERGTVLSAAGVGTLAAVGIVRPRVVRRLRIAVITTGDELVGPGVAPAAYQIRNSNGPAVVGVLGARAWIEVVSCTHTRDDGQGLREAVRAAMASADAVVLTGGVSMGHRDPVRGVVEAAGGEVVFHGLPQKPGKPMLGALVAVGGARVPVFGLPGNPISAMVTCTRIVVPVLARAAGITEWPGPRRVAVTNPDGRAMELWQHRLVCCTACGGVELVDGRGSGDIIAGGRSDGFIEVPPGAADTGPLFPFYAWPT